MSIDPILKPRIEQIPPVSPAALDIFNQSLVWDAILPWARGSNADHIDIILPRYQRVGVDFVSLTVGLQPGIEETMRHIASVRRAIADRNTWVVLAQTTQEVQNARAAGKLAVGLNFQDPGPLQNSLDMIAVYRALGVRQIGLAYNTRNLLADGGAEDEDARLSRLGIAAVRAMNRAGILVDGSHAGRNSTLHAMEIGDRPFIFSHSNPFSIRPHYRSVTDDQIKACAATGGVVGINGVGFWVGDLDAPTEAIFRCLDYTVETIGPRHVGLGFDYIYDLQHLMGVLRGMPDVWPAYRGEQMVLHNYAGPEQMVELVQMMLDHGYAREHIEMILGGNWNRVYALCE
jgi:membrane dipeptidase